MDASFVPVGEVLTIKVIESMNHRLQRRWRFKYEVVSDGADIGKVGYVYGRDLLSRSKLYTVRFNDDSTFPQIEEILDVAEASAGK